MNCLMKISNVLVLVAFVLCIGFFRVEGRGFSGGYRRIRYSASRSSYGSTFTDHRISSPSSVRKALLAGTVYGANIWRLRKPDYYHDDDALPTICYNDGYNHSKNGNVSFYGRFVCPMDYQGFEYSYCCRDEGLQNCCTFWDDYRRVSTLVFIIVLVVGGVAFFIFCLVKLRRAKSRLGSRLWKKMDVPCSAFKSDKREEKPPMPASDINDLRF